RLPDPNAAAALGGALIQAQEQGLAHVRTEVAGEGRVAGEGGRLLDNGVAVVQSGLVLGAGEGGHDGWPGLLVLRAVRAGERVRCSRVVGLDLHQDRQVIDVIGDLDEAATATAASKVVKSHEWVPPFLLVPARYG